MTGESGVTRGLDSVIWGLEKGLFPLIDKTVFRASEMVIISIFL